MVATLSDAHGVEKLDVSSGGLPRLREFAGLLQATKETKEREFQSADVCDGTISLYIICACNRHCR